VAIVARVMVGKPMVGKNCGDECKGVNIKFAEGVAGVGQMGEC
jgi:hypothetical protein